MIRGLEGVQARVSDIQARIAQLSPQRQKLNAASELSGSFPAVQDGNAPLFPFSKDVGIEPMGRESLLPLVEKAANEAGIDPKLLDALVRAESGYDFKARSSAGAMGLTQLMPGTATSLGVKDPYDPLDNLRGGAQYLAQMLDQFESLPLALAAYNAGPGAVVRAGNEIPNYRETRQYVDRVLANYRSQ